MISLSFCADSTNDAPGGEPRGLRGPVSDLVAPDPARVEGASRARLEQKIGDATTLRAR